MNPALAGENYSMDHEGATMRVCGVDPQGGATNEKEMQEVVKKVYDMLIKFECMKRWLPC